MHADRWTPLRSLLPGACASLAILQSCAQIVSDAHIDGGGSSLPSVADVQPQPGLVLPAARFRVAFSAPMDLALLLIEPERSDTVALVAEVDADLIAAAMAHGRLTAAQRSRLVPATASAPADARSLALAPLEPLPPGSYALLVSSKLKDGEGRKLAGNGARFVFTVAAPDAGAQPRLDTPAPASTVPKNLRRVRVAFPDGPPDAPVSLVEEGGATAAGPARADGGSLLLEIDARHAPAGCHPLCAGATYALRVGEREVAGATFRASACERTAPPSFADGGADVRVGDTWAEVALQLDWPALVTVKARPLAALPDAGSCDGGAVETTALVRCAVDACGDGGPAVCAAVVHLRGLAASAAYLLRAEAEDDEGNAVSAIEVPFETLGALPEATISEVMASPPLPTPRSDGEYVEILNAGRAPLDLARLALAGPDDRPRPLVGGSSTSATRLGPGERALAVGADFDARRYSLPTNLTIVRADTRKLLGRGLADQPPALRLLWLPDAAGSADGGAAVEIDRTDGAAPRCAVGQSLERQPASDGGSPSLRCGADGGSPGIAPAG